MKIKGIITVAVLFLVSAGSAFAQKVNVDYDHGANFAKYKSYAWIESKNRVASDLTHKRIIEAIEQQLTAKGVQKTDSNPDLLVVYNAGLKEEVSVQGYSYGYAPYRWGGGTVHVNKVVELRATLVVDLVDAQQQQLVWRGIATDTVSDNPEKNIKKINKAAEKMFKKFPPPGK
jgi:hypothetical protein